MDMFKKLKKLYTSGKHVYEIDKSIHVPENGDEVHRRFVAELSGQVMCDDGAFFTGKGSV